jgi:pilus assembly protein CpaD
MRHVAILRPAAAVASAVLAAALLSGCAKLGRDHIEVGAIPDDYRTRHPVVIAESQKQLAVPVGASAREMSFAEKEVVRGFLSGYDSNGGGAITILVPQGRGNQGAAGHAANQVLAIGHEMGFGGRTMISGYSAPHGHNAPPVLVTYSAVTASAGPCGKWDADILPDSENKQYGNFGCAMQNNLAAQVANPMDLLHPRRTGPIDAADRDKVIDDYRKNSGTWESTIEY